MHGNQGKGQATPRTVQVVMQRDGVLVQDHVRRQDLVPQRQVKARQACTHTLLSQPVSSL